MFYVRSDRLLEASVRGKKVIGLNVNILQNIKVILLTSGGIY